MNMRELEAQAKALAPVFGKLLEQAKAALRQEFKTQIDERDQRIAELEKAVADRPDLKALSEQAAALIPVPKNGDPGKDADMGALKDHLAELVGNAVKGLPAATPGKDADMDALRAHLDALVKGIEPPAAPSVDEVAATFERRFSDLTLSWERQARDTFEKAADRMPTPKNGRDALPLDSFDLTLGEDERTVTVKMQAGETVIEKSVKIPAVIDRGVFNPERATQKGYECGDGVTYGGCFWLAQKDAPKGVPGGEGDWRLAVKKGRDGKDLRDSASTHDASKGVKIRKEGDDK